MIDATKQPREREVGAASRTLAAEARLGRMLEPVGELHKEGAARCSGFRRTSTRWRPLLAVGPSRTIGVARGASSVCRGTDSKRVSVKARAVGLPCPNQVRRAALKRFGLPGFTDPASWATVLRPTRACSGRATRAAEPHTR